MRLEFGEAVSMPKLVLALSALLVVCGFSGSKSGVQPMAAPQAQDAAAAAPVALPPDTKNPVKATPESQAKAKKMYGYDCAMCHGDTGDGKTDLAKDIGPLTDLTDTKTLDGKSDAALYDLIKNGKGKMPGEDGPRAKPEDLWNLVIYVRGLAKK